MPLGGGPTGCQIRTARSTQIARLRVQFCTKQDTGGARCCQHSCGHSRFCRYSYRTVNIATTALTRNVRVYGDQCRYYRAWVVVVQGSVVPVPEAATAQRRHVRLDADERLDDDVGYGGHDLVVVDAVVAEPLQQSLQRPLAAHAVLVGVDVPSEPLVLTIYAANRAHEDNEGDPRVTDTGQRPYPGAATSALPHVN